MPSLVLVTICLLFSGAVEWYQVPFGRSGILISVALMALLFPPFPRLIACSWSLWFHPNSAYSQPESRPQIYHRMLPLGQSESPYLELRWYPDPRAFRCRSHGHTGVVISSWQSPSQSLAAFVQASPALPPERQQPSAP